MKEKDNFWKAQILRMKVMVIEDCFKCLVVMVKVVLENGGGYPGLS